MAAVHNESALVHSSLGTSDEIQEMRSSSPGRVDVGPGVEDGFQILPLTCISASAQVSD